MGESGSFDVSLDLGLILPDCFDMEWGFASIFLGSFGSGPTEGPIKFGIIDNGMEGPNAAAKAGERTERGPGFSPPICERSGNKLLESG